MNKNRIFGRSKIAFFRNLGIMISLTTRSISPGLPSTVAKFVPNTGENTAK